MAIIFSFFTHSFTLFLGCEKSTWIHIGVAKRFFGTKNCSNAMHCIEYVWFYGRIHDVFVEYYATNVCGNYLKIEMIGALKGSVDLNGKILVCKKIGAI